MEIALLIVIVLVALLFVSARPVALRARQNVTLKLPGAN
jgi:hypothetical protein